MKELSRRQWKKEQMRRHWKNEPYMECDSRKPWQQTYTDSLFDICGSMVALNNVKKLKNEQKTNKGGD